MKTRILIFAALIAAACQKTPKTEVPAGALRFGPLALVVEGGFPGQAEAELHVAGLDADGRPVATELQGEYVMPAMGAMAEMRAKLRSPAAEHHRVHTELGMGGKWSLRLEVKAGERSIELHHTANSITGEFAFERSTPPPDAGATQGVTAPAGAKGVYVPEERRQLIGVKYYEAMRMPLQRTVRAFGRVVVSEQSLTDVNVRAGGWVHRLFVKTEGARVTRGQALMSVNSPELAAAQEEFLIAAGGSDDALAAAATGKLEVLGLDRAQIDRLRTSKKVEKVVTIRSPQSGYLLRKDVVAGARVEPGMTAFQIGNLGKIWIVADVFEQDTPYMQAGLRARVRLPVGGREVSGRVNYVYPSIDEKTRTLPVRLEFTNLAEALKPGMFVDVYIELPPVSGVAVPFSAVLLSGEHQYLFVDRGEGFLEPREVAADFRAGDFIRVTRGLEGGERVVMSANFLLSSETMLQNALPDWDRRAAPRPAGPPGGPTGHEGHGAQP